MAYKLKEDKRVHVDLGNRKEGYIKENYVPAQNTGMIYIGIGISALVLVILLYMLYKKTQN